MPGIIGPGGAGGVGPSGNPQVTFANEVAKQTGLDPRVVYAWTVVEGASAPGGTGHFNFLNLRPYPGDPSYGVSSGGFELFSTVENAIKATVTRINQPFAKAIVDSTGRDPATQIAAIASTGWDAGHYAVKGVKGASLVSEFTKLYGGGALGKAPETGKPLPAAGGGKSGDQTSAASIAGGIVGDVESWLATEGKLVLAYLVLVGVAGALFVTGLKGLGVPTPKLPKAVPVPV